MRHSMKGLLVVGLLSAAAVTYAATSSQASGPATVTQIAAAVKSETEGKTPSGKVEFTGGQIAAGVGYAWGNGTLTFQGQQHKFRINGLSVANVGATTISASGDVYNLTKLSDFSGNYAAVGVGVTIAGGGTLMSLKNNHGVVINIVSTQQGLDFQLSANGIKFTLE